MARFFKLILFNAAIAAEAPAHTAENDIRLTECDAEYLARNGKEVDPTVVVKDTPCLTDDSARALVLENTFNFRWTNMWSPEDNKYVIPYLFEDGYANWHNDMENKKDMIREKLKDFEKSTCIKIEETNVDAGGRFKFVDGNDCSSFVGRKNELKHRAQKITMSVEKGCEEGNTPLHEVMHALGFWHEQQRPDRDNYVSIHPNLESDINYERMDTYDMNYGWDQLNPKSKYDFASIMHYDSWEHDFDGRPNIGKHDDFWAFAPVIVSDTFSQEDIRQLDYAYPCGEDECALGSHDCHLYSNSICVNQPVLWSCECAVGFGWNELTMACEDERSNECALGTHNCHENASCTNADLYFTCHCNPGYYGDGWVCSEKCATIYDNYPTKSDGGPSYPLGASFSTGTFSVVELTGMTTVDREGWDTQEGPTNWKPTRDIADKISFIQVEPKCVLQGFRRENFHGLMANWRGSHTHLNVHEMSVRDDNTMKSYKCTCNNLVSCDEYYTYGNPRVGCPAPQCDVASYSVSDSWRNVRSSVPRYGYALHVTIPQEFVGTPNGWSILLRFTGSNSAHFQLWRSSAYVFNVYHTRYSIEFLIHERFNLEHDLNDHGSFAFIANQLFASDLPEIYFFHGRQRKHRCFGGQSETRTDLFNRAIQSSDLKSNEDVQFVAVSRKGNMRVRA